jgi:alpha-galactosidase
LDLGRRRCRLSQAEQLTVMSLWAIARSPLMHGGDMTQMDDFTFSLLSNAEVIAVNQGSVDNRPLFDRDGLIAWCARPEGTDDRYLALFNARDREPLDPAHARFVVSLSGAQAAARHAIDVAVEPGGRLLLVADDGNGGDDGHHAVVWDDPLLHDGPGGTLPLGELAWLRATSRWGSVMRNDGPGGRALELGGSRCTRGLGVHIKSLIELEVPAGYRRLTASCGFEGPAARAAQARARCLVFVAPREPSEQGVGMPLAVTWEELGLEGPARARDLWSGEELGSFATGIELTIPWHGARLLRIGR